MRTVSLWTGAILLCVSAVWGQVDARGQISRLNGIEFNPPLIASAQMQKAHPHGSVAPAPVSIHSFDESKNNWSRVTKVAEEFPFFVDHASFIAKGSFSFVEFYVQISHNRLRFTRNGQSYQAVYDIDLYVEDRDGNLVLSQSAHDTVRVSSYDETGAADSYRVTLLNSYLRPGNYRLRVMMTDKEIGRSAEVAQDFGVRDFSGQNLMLSDLQFSRNIQVDSSLSPFVKHNRRIEPNVLHLYGQFAGHLFLYYEIYNLAQPRLVGVDNAPPLLSSSANGTDNSVPADSFRVLYEIRDESGKWVKHLWKVGRKPGASCVKSVLLPIEDLPSGQYTVTVRVFDDQYGAVAEVSDRFSMYWHVFSFKDQKFEEVLEQMRYIAKRDELKKLSQLPETDRQRGLFEFWRRRDPTPGTPQNEVMDEYYRRIRYANRHFKWFGGEGWKSPQGKIYITYGPPDEIRLYQNADGFQESDGWISTRSRRRSNEFPSLFLAARSSQYDNATYELWEYNQLNRRFVFVDTSGMGTFKLVGPLSFE